MNMKRYSALSKLTRAQKDAIYEYAEELADKKAKRCHWILLLAFADELKLGITRVNRCIDRYERYLDEYVALKEEDSADDILTLRIRQRKWADIYEI